MTGFIIWLKKNTQLNQLLSISTLLPNSISRIKLHAPTKVILEFYKSNINNLSKKDKPILVQTFVYVLLSNLLIFGQTIDVSLTKL